MRTGSGQCHDDLAGISSSGGDDDFSVGVFADAFELLAPLNEDDGVWRAHLFDAQGIELALGVQALEVNMQELDWASVERACVFMD